MTALVLLRCHDCAAERPFEQPVCRDGHGTDCLEWCCTDCGSARLVGQLVEPRAQAVRASPAGRPPARSAA